MSQLAKAVVRTDVVSWDSGHYIREINRTGRYFFIRVFETIGLSCGKTIVRGIDNYGDFWYAVSRAGHMYGMKHEEFRDQYGDLFEDGKIK